MVFTVKNPPANAGDSGDMGPLSLSWEDPLEEEMATCSNILAWRIPRTEEPGGLESNGVEQSWTQRNTAENQPVKHVLKASTLSMRSSQNILLKSGFCMQ